MSKTILSILAGLGGMFGWGTSDFFASQSSEKIGHFKTFFWSQLVGLIIAILLIPFFNLNTNFDLTLILLLLIAPIFYTAGYLFFYKAFEVGNVSVVSAVANLWAVTTPAIAFIFLGQRLTTAQFFGVVLIVHGVILVSVKISDLKDKKIKLLNGVKEALIASFIFGVFWNLSDIITEKIGWFSITLFIKVGVIIFLLLFSQFSRQKLKTNTLSTKTKLTVALVGVLEAVGVASVNYGLSVGDVILVSPISSALSVVTIAMAIVFLKEKVTKMQGLGMALVLAGIVCAAF